MFAHTGRYVFMLLYICKYSKLVTHTFTGLLIVINIDKTNMVYDYISCHMPC